RNNEIRRTTMLRQLCAAVLSLSITFTASAVVVAEGTPEASPTPKARMPDYLAGNAYDLLPQGQPGKLDVILVGPLLDNALPIVIRNNTEQPIDDVEAFAVAQD